MSVGVVFQGTGQETEEEIYANQSANTAFFAFVRSLGWPIKVAKHAGFLGGLDRKGSTGESAVYYADHAAELVYHVAPLMPSDGAANLHKKRLVSKDYVLVVWSEDGLYDDTALESPLQRPQYHHLPPRLWPLQRPCHSQRQARGSHRSSTHRASPGHHRCRQVRPRAPCPPHGNERVPRHRGLSHRARTPLRPPPAHSSQTSSATTARTPHLALFSHPCSSTATQTQRSHSVPQRLLSQLLLQSSPSNSNSRGLSSNRKDNHR